LQIDRFSSLEAVVERYKIRVVL